MERLKKNIIDFFEQTLAKYGDSPQGVNYQGRQSQYQRFEILAALAQLGGKEILDIGCGLGHFYDFLREHGITPRNYQGLDITPGMIAGAQQRNPELNFTLLDILAEPAPTTPCYDYVFCCGLFHYRGNNSNKDWQEFCEVMIARAFQYARYGLAFNMMTDQVDYQEEQNYYADPCHFFNYTRTQLSRSVSLRHDYPLYDFTIYVYKTRDQQKIVSS